METVELVLFGPKNPEALKLMTAINHSEEKNGGRRTKLIGFLHSDVALHGTKFRGVPILGDFGIVPDLAARGVRFVTLVSSSTGARYSTARQLIAGGGELTQFIHPSVDQSWSEIGLGSYIQEGVVVQADARIGTNCTIHTGTIVAHEAKIGNSVSITHAVSISGEAIVEDGAYIGTNATLLPKVRIGAWATVGAGAVVIRDVPDLAVVVGNPARIIKYNEKRYSHGNPYIEQD